MTHKNQSKFIIEIETPKLMSKISMLRIRLVKYYMFYTILWLDYPTIMARYNIKKKKKVEYIKDLNSLTVSELTLLSVDYSLQTMVMVIIKLLLTVDNFNRPF